MINRWLGYLVAAGAKDPRRDALVLLLIPLLAAGVTFEWLKVPGLSIAVFCIAAGFEYELLQMKLNARKRRILAAWPIVVESLESAAIAGMSLLESLRDLADSDQLFVAREFAECCMEIDSGVPFEQSLDGLKAKFGTHASDFTIELLKLTNDLGSAGYVAALRNQTAALRLDSNLRAELEAKQGWVVGTAKLAIIAPWLIVAVLSIRPENSALYSSAAGTAILLLGLLGSAVALRMVYRIGNLASTVRVFA